MCGHMKWNHGYNSWYSVRTMSCRCRIETLDATYFRYVALFEMLVWAHEVEPWFHSWYRGRVETLDAKYNLIFR